MSNVSQQGDGASMTAAPIPSLSSAQTTNPLQVQGLTPNPVSITPIIMDSSVLPQGQMGGVVSLPQQTFCFSAGGFTTSNISPGVALPTSSVPTVSTAHLNALPVGSVFNLNPRLMNPQFMHSITIPQQQTLNLPLNQPSQQHQTSMPVAQSLTLGPNPGPGGSATSAIPLNQMVTPGINLMNQTVLTMPHPSNGQPQFIPQHFGQIPLVFGNPQQPILTTTINPVTSQTNSTAALSHQNPELTTSVSFNIPSASTAAVSTVSTSPALISQIGNSNNNKSLPDSTNNLDLNGPESSLVSSESSVVSSSSSNSSSTGGCIAAASPGTTSVTVFTGSKETSVPSSLSGSKPSKVSSPGEMNTVNPLPKSAVGCARMKFTPMDQEGGVDPRFHQAKVLLVNESDEEESEEEDDECRSNSSSPVDVNERGSIDPSPTNVKLELFDESERNLVEEDQCKPSPVPSDGQEGFQKSDTQGDLADVEDLEEAEFAWEDYLKETGALSVPPTAFKHVELSLQSGFVKGMKLEAPNKHSPNTYWVATVVMTCGPLLRLRYEGYKDNSSADFWSDPMTSDIHPVGWCEKNGKILQPPSVIQEKYSNWNEFLQNALSNASLAPEYLLDKSTGATPVDQIREGMELEIQASLQPHHVWVVKIVENIGGRLGLRYHGIDGSTSHDLWLFYLDDRLHPLGWCKEVGYEYVPPKEIIASSEKTEEHLIQDLESGLAESLDQRSLAAIFQDQREIQPHSFQVGMKLEAVDPVTLANICPATVSEVICDKYFLVEMDDLSTKEKTVMCCHSLSHNIFPINWASNKGIKVTTPSGWAGKEFMWEEYLEDTKGTPAPEDFFNLETVEHEFECGMKMEVVNPDQDSHICAATITKVVGPLLWVHLDSSRKVMDGHVESIHALTMFPISWCISNGYQLQPPRRSFTSASRKRIAVVQPEIVEEDQGTTQPQSSASYNRDLFGGPQVYFNHLCFSGPFLSKGRIAELPRSVGPGPVTLVMKEVMSKLIQTAYKSSRVLRELQLEGRPGPGMTVHMLKAKYKGKSYRAQVEICRGANQLEEFSRNMCIKLQCCPNLVSPHRINGECPENCSQLTKTKYTYYYGKRKKKIGRPPGGQSNLENGQKKPGKRKKRKKIGMITKHSSQPTIGIDEQADNDDDKASVCSDTRTIDSTSTSGSKERAETSKLNNNNNSSSAISKENLLKRRYTHHIPPPSEIQTRGAKLPKYSFEKRTHKKIMVVEGEQRPPGSLKKEPGQHYQDSGYGGKEGATSFSPMRPDLPIVLKSEPPLKLETNPLEWTVAEVGEFLMTTDCGDRELLQKLRTEEIDGQALLLLTLPNVQEYMGIKLGPAIKLCHLIERIKLAFYQHFAK